MSVQPYVPSSARADRTLLFGTDKNEVMRADESILTQDGSTVTAYWTSPSLNRGPEGIHNEYTLSKVVLFYSATAATTVTLTVSPDGGVTWTAPNAVASTTTIAQTAGQLKNVVTAFNVTGDDLRLRIQFTTDVAVKIFGYTPTLLKRGRVNFA